MNNTNITEKELEDLVRLAAKSIYAIEERGDLETRDSDDEDFMSISVWELKQALVEAYSLGKASK